MSSGLSEGLTRDLRQEVMQTGVICGYRLSVGEWEERYHIETTRPSADDVPVQSHRDQRAAFNRQSRGGGAKQ